MTNVRHTNDILLPHELLHGASAIYKQCSILVPHTLQSRALKDHVAFVPNLELLHGALSSCSFKKRGSCGNANLQFLVAWFSKSAAGCGRSSIYALEALREVLEVETADCRQSCQNT